MANLSLERHPNFMGEAHRAIHDALTQAVKKNNQQVMEHLIAAWDADHNLQKAEQAQRGQEAEALQLAEEEALCEHREAEKC
ncbi:hypothetical protein PAXRUDRAFT_18218 [Paxillus rubicundulus Ve08.2h10]|uniref:Uncharacterized protein n=1 Tax=Paxillus rubicundulus Ve08.2h10 TaxID=930991 RepID=A0A0D0BZG9_9AGAM|nr:hypothetical protein PAXRUDRAFT_18218 [Paxillus rubicundulus Ve08.2h10]